jgi:UDP-N-acetylmuramate--alanine ligase
MIEKPILLDEVLLDISKSTPFALDITKAIHFIGIGGIGMSGIAEILIKKGFNVSGSDLTENKMTKRLAQLGARIFCGHQAEHIAHSDVVVISTAFKLDNAELIEAKKKSLVILKRAQMLAALMQSFYGIAISGAHGKTTTSSLVSTLFLTAGLNPTLVVGGVLPALSSNAH